MPIRDPADEARQDSEPTPSKTRGRRDAGAPRPAFHDAASQAAGGQANGALAGQRLTRARLHRLLSYYRPHLPLLGADLACAALLLPLCANLSRAGLLPLTQARTCSAQSRSLARSCSSSSPCRRWPGSS